MHAKSKTGGKRAKLLMFSSSSSSSSLCQIFKGLQFAA
jgi:hypothetical protein